MTLSALLRLHDPVQALDIPILALVVAGVLVVLMLVVVT